MHRPLRRFLFVATAVAASIVLYAREARADYFSDCANGCVGALCSCSPLGPCTCFDSWAQCTMQCVRTLCQIPDDPICYELPNEGRSMRPVPSQVVAGEWE
jgi:hypothetical protein